ncbi:dihydroneopterin aldolase [Myxococcus xanthus]|uniref:dihydroneopterin aldolase n=1 Tax=Myxococcus xanthus TaxID=34 RepID=A0A7Y4IES8_MYXXA|nr:dihydroneopterin aldolase [Myxococcus xanthus]NOJ77854.1 FolB domain-containing protein [Myxococcus xanthus]NOJ84107.1 FolB domain-containing protein [Myxococcus xanthus]
MSAEHAFHPPVVMTPDGRPLDVIELRGLTVDCIVGIFNRERIAAQPLRLDVALFLDTRAAAVGGRLAHTVNYGRLAGELRFLLEACRFELLESAVETVCRYVLAPPTDDVPRAQVHAATVRVTKPLALGGLAVPSLQIHRTAAEMVYGREEKGFGRVDIIHEGAGYGVYRLRVKPGGCIPTHVHQQMEESELVLGSGLLLQFEPVARGMAFHWPRGFLHRYDNPSSTEQTVLCVDRPGFIPSDEVETEPPPEGLLPVTGHSYYPLDEPAAPGSPAENQP